MKEQLYNVMETARLLKIRRNRVYDLINSGILPAMNLGGYKIRASSIDKFIEKYDGYDLTDLNCIKKCK
ncbi:helix-turn-helix domain-containing protein [[Clostridium] spiroforme]|nr:helix-turn-helix domain-containing protein [Thomasclavelia spiroformis]